MKSLKTLLQEYLTLRRSLGFSLKSNEIELKHFVKFADARGCVYISLPVALEWATRSGTAKGKGSSRRIQILRDFAKYAHVESEFHEIPHPMTMPPVIKRRKVPHVYSDQEVLQTMKAARQHLQGQITPHTYETLLGLLSCTGMRVSEAIQLDCTDFRAKDSALIIRKDKRGNTREVILHPSTVIKLEQYCLLRDSIFKNSRSPALLVSNTGARLHRNNVSPMVRKLLKIVGLYKEGQRPTIHDLRHTFAINTVQKWYHGGNRVEAKLALLSTYLGHVDPSSTYWYLTATPELMACAAARLENHGRIIL